MPIEMKCLGRTGCCLAIMHIVVLLLNIISNLNRGGSQYVKRIKDYVVKCQYVIFTIMNNNYLQEIKNRRKVKRRTPRTLIGSSDTRFDSYPKGFIFLLE